VRWMHTVMWDCLWLYRSILTTKPPQIEIHHRCCKDRSIGWTVDALWIQALLWRDRLADVVCECSWHWSCNHECGSVELHDIEHRCALLVDIWLESRRCQVPSDCLIILWQVSVQRGFGAHKWAISERELHVLHCVLIRIQRCRI